MPDLDQLGELAYETFCASLAAVYVPPRRPLWAQLPEPLQQAWKATAAKLLKSK